MKYIMLTILLLLAACAPQQTITSFEECVAAGNPIMESYPRQCRAGNNVFTETIISEPTFTVCAERSQACTREYRPVCGLADNGVRCITTPCASQDALTFGNACTACANASTSGYYEGACEEQRFTICEETQTGFNVTAIAAENGWICVETCPGNYDEFGTQIGSRMCIERATAAQIATWQTCDRSSADCNCVRAYETTDGQQIDNAAFRCVPELYAERLLFRGGQERLDENGEQSVLIA